MACSKKKVIYAFWGTWQHYSNERKHFEITDIDPQLCTHLAYAFLGVAEDGSIKHLDEWLDINLGYISKAIALKNSSPELKVLAAVGGWNVGSKSFSVMASDPCKRANFVRSAQLFVNQHGFDGLDIDWEYPAQRDGQYYDVENFVVFLRELRVALGSNKLIAVSVAALESSASKSYNIPHIAAAVDFINLMCYDYAGTWSSCLGFNAPLGQVKASIQYWLRNGAPPSKLLTGIPLYGRIFTLENQQKTDVGNLCIQNQNGDGTLDYHEICDLLKENDWRQNWNTTDMVPYAFKGNQWISYDDPRSILSKISLINDYNLGGAMVWSIEKDDFRGVSGQKYPLMRAINNGLLK